MAWDQENQARKEPLVSDEPRPRHGHRAKKYGLRITHVYHATKLSAERRYSWVNWYATETARATACNAAMSGREWGHLKGFMHVETEDVNR